MAFLFLLLVPVLIAVGTFFYYRGHVVWQELLLQLLAFMGYPKVDLAQFKIVTSNETAEAFKSGEAAPIKLR